MIANLFLYIYAIKYMQIASRLCVKTSLWLYYRFTLHKMNLMRKYLCEKEHSNDL